MKQNNKNSWIIFVVIILAIAVIGTIIGIATTKSPEKVVENAFEALKEGDLKKISKNKLEDTAKLFENELSSELSSSDEETNSIDGMSENDKKDLEEVLKVCFSDFEYKITNTKVEKNIAKVTVESTNKDFTKVVTNAMTEIFSKAFSAALKNEELSAEETFNTMKNAMEGVTDKKSSTKELTLKKEKGKWQLQYDDNLKETLFPGIDEGLKSYINTISSMYDQYDDYDTNTVDIGNNL